MNDEIAALVVQFKREQAQRARNLIAYNRAWAADHGVEFVGMAGRLTGAGAIEYPVFREPDGTHFALQTDAPSGPTRVPLGADPRGVGWYWTVDEWLRTHIHVDFGDEEA